RRITTGALQEDGLRVVTEGLKPKEVVVVGGLQQLRPKMEIKPDTTPMPTISKGKGQYGDQPDGKSPADKPKDDGSGNKPQEK
ncbi:MAG TPA: hypothetical protein VGM98_06100, partial [Schlesneria sp.]